MQPDAFLDTNVILRQVLQDHPDHSPRATALIVAIEQSQRAVRLADTVVFEAAFTLETTYGVPRSEIHDALQPILDLAGIVLPGKRMFDDVFDLHVREAALSFADCYHATLAKHKELTQILSFDRTMGRIPGVERIEPLECLSRPVTGGGSSR